MRNRPEIHGLTYDLITDLYTNKYGDKFNPETLQVVRDKYGRTAYRFKIGPNRYSVFRGTEVITATTTNNTTTTTTMSLITCPACGASISANPCWCAPAVTEDTDRLLDEAILKARQLSFDLDKARSATISQIAHFNQLVIKTDAAWSSVENLAETLGYDFTEEEES